MEVIQLIKIVYGIIIILLLPGMVVSYTLFGKNTIDAIERAALSFALSIAIVPLLVLGVSLMGMKINVGNVSFIVFLVIATALLVILIRNYKKLN